MSLINALLISPAPQVSHLCQKVLHVRLDPEAADAAAASGDAGPVRDLPHPSDVTHHELLLLMVMMMLLVPSLPLTGLRRGQGDVQLILLVWRKNKGEKNFKTGNDLLFRSKARGTPRER